MRGLFTTFLLALCLDALSATIAIIDTGFDLDHDFLKQKIMKGDLEEETLKLEGWAFHDNSHVKTPITQDTSSVKDILRFRSLKAKGYREGLTMEEFEWFKVKSADKVFMELVKNFKRQAHGTFVASIALREGENINIFPIRGLSARIPVVAVEDSSPEAPLPRRSGKPEQDFQQEIKDSINRVSQKFSKICSYLSRRNIEVVNASYGISYKSIMTRFREKYREITGKEIVEEKLQTVTDNYFQELYRRGEKTIKKYPRMLFVFSAGNHGLDNDRFHHYPSRIKGPNIIRVAAMNGNFLASFSNYGEENVDIGAPGVAIQSMVPSIYSTDGIELYSPASGTSMAAPYISNVAAQVLNMNPTLTPVEVKRIIMETGEIMLHLKPRLNSGAVVNNEKALKAAQFSKEMSLEEALSLARFDLIPMVDKTKLGQAPTAPAQELQKKVLETLPAREGEVEELPSAMDEVPTKAVSSPLKDVVREQPDNSVPPASVIQAAQVEPSDQAPASQNAE